MITNKEIITYLKQNKLMGKAYVIHWFLRDIYLAEGKPEWLANGTFIGYVKKNYKDLPQSDPIGTFIKTNFSPAKILYDKLKEKKLIITNQEIKI